MPRFFKHEVITKMLEAGLLPTFYEKNIELAKKVVQACVEGGARVVEFTNRGPFAYQVFSELAKLCDQEFHQVILGGGTITDPATASLYINSGANFIVGPVFNPEVSRLCNRHKAVYIPGCSSPSEISSAEETGVEIVKLFPARVLGPYFIESLLGPCPQCKLMPSGGVEATSEDIFRWIRAGAAVLNIGTSLIGKDYVRTQDFEGIRKRVEQCILWIKEARGTPLFSGVEHVAIYPSNETSAEEIAQWYSEMFGWSRTEGTTSIMVAGEGPGRIEIMKNQKEGVKCHVAIYVSDFEKACKYLGDKGVKLEEPVVKKNIKAVYLKDTDPLGNMVHLIQTS